MQKKSIYTLWVALLFSVLLQDATADFIQDCIALNHKYALARDHGDVAAYGKLFADDAVFVMQGKAYEGKQAILERLGGSESNYFARLLITTVDITPNSATTASGVVYFTMFHTPVENSKSLPITSYALFMGEYHDRYRLTEQGCQIVRRETKPLFMGEQ